MFLWTSLPRRHLPRWLATESASAVIMAGTMAFAGASAMALQPQSAVRPATFTQMRIMLLAPQPGFWSCQTVTLSACVQPLFLRHHPEYWGQHWAAPNQVIPVMPPAPMQTTGLVYARLVTP